jgi:hypothetical protein
MMYLPVLFFAIAAIGGLTLATMKFTGKGLSMPLAIVHGIIAATGLVLLIVNVLMDTSNMLMNISLALFVATALGGFTLFSFHIRKKKTPDVLIYVHGTAAVTSFIVLLFAVFK